MRIICDVCDKSIGTRVCEYCGYDNSDQYSSGNNSIRAHIISYIQTSYINSYPYVDEEQLVTAIIERFGVSEHMAELLVQEYFCDYDPFMEIDDELL